MFKRPFLFIIPGMLGEDKRLHEFCTAISDLFCPVIVDHEDGDGCRGLKVAGSRLAHRLTEIQGEGEINLVGYSYGANVAFEAASVLRRSGRQVPLVGIIDPALPDTEFGVFTDEPARVRDFEIRDSSLILFLLRRKSLWAISRLLPDCSFKKLIRRRMCVKMRYWARREWSPEPLPLPGILVTSTQLHDTTNRELRMLCPVMRHIKVESRHIDVLGGTAGRIIADAIGELRRGMSAQTAEPSLAFS